jgi:hypothetical protein
MAALASFGDAYAALPSHRAACLWSVICLIRFAVRCRCNHPSRASLTPLPPLPWPRVPREFSGKQRNFLDYSLERTLALISIGTMCHDLGANQIIRIRENPLPS